MKLFEKLSILLLLIGMAACAHGPLRERVSSTARNARMVEYVAVVGSPLAWKSSGYWRQEDLGWPPQVVFAKDRTACPLWQIVVFEPEPDTFFICPTQWRVNRP